MFDYAAPGNSLINIQDIARPLANNCRFAGHLPWHYSIAQHAVNVSRLVPDDLAFTGLMHDTSEAFTNDITTPLKVALPAFKDLEVSIETEMARQFGFQFPLPPEVKLADLQMLKVEKELIKQDFSDWEVLHGVEDPPLDDLCLDPLTPDQAYELFMERFYELAS
ncbi:hypothetical protein KNJ79_04975 [Sphingopyxis indica]|uniref:YfbR-like 5'-deoxynucleotidase n=1 Tax=Sphingopyxis indica TaxID=436663 RepID=UPI002938DCA9|nr:YfbR-like 5'-deoxynucleotidase [Sphingopyxis indica]WOF44284.1 hypothetical protein KNJ79_04975 [Sphingopyxis indica]